MLLKNNSNKIKAPGSALKKHYSPGIPMKLNQKKGFKNYAFIAFLGKIILNQKIHLI